MLAILLPSHESSAQANIASGQVRYTYLGTNTSSGFHNYRIDVDLLKSCPGDTFPAGIDINVFRKGDYSRPVYRVIGLRPNPRGTITPPGVDVCVYNFPDVCFSQANYFANIWVPESPQGLDVLVSAGERERSITNLIDGQNAGLMASIPGYQADTSAPKNSSPLFKKNEAVVICEYTPFKFDASATDPEGDSVSYFLGSGYSDGGTPFLPLDYRPPFAGTWPFGMDININLETGVIEGTAPIRGKYLVTVCVVEYRKGIPIAVNRREFLFKVGDCSITRAALNPKTMGCRDFTMDFQNNVSNPYIRSYSWDFGVGSSTTDTSSLSNPRFTFPDTGIYRVRLIINEGTFCDDTAFTNVYVYPTLRPDFRLRTDCIFPRQRVEFIESSTNTYGTINYWRWDLGQLGPNGVNDLSTDRNPVYNGYNKSDSFQIELWIGNTMGCVDTLRRKIRILSYDMLTLSNDTAICVGDTVQLHANGIGTVQWTPAVRISDPNNAHPFVYPNVRTQYNASLTLFPGCTIDKKVTVDAKQFISVDAGRDTTVCLSDTFALNTVSDALKFRWTPATTLDNPNAKNPRAHPNGDIKYYVTANTGSCVAIDSVQIYTVPYPVISFSNDTVLCFGDQVQLFATGGVNYLWTPSTALSSATIANPIASPVSSITYRVAVTDNKGCPKPVYGEVAIEVIPKIKPFAGYDTAIIAGQPLQMQATGGDRYQWSPATGLSNAAIANPVATIDRDFTYRVRVSTEEGCFAYDDIKVKVFRTAPEIFVPNAFTPNGDGKNDQLRPTPVGIKQFDYFRVYNRWGQLIYQTYIPTVGWDGNFAGKPMASGTYVWESKGLDYTGKVMVKRGSFVLIR